MLIYMQPEHTMSIYTMHVRAHRLQVLLRRLDLTEHNVSGNCVHVSWKASI